MLCLHLFVYSLDVMQNYFYTAGHKDRTHLLPSISLSIQQDCVDVNSRNIRNNTGKWCSTTHTDGENRDWQRSMLMWASGRNDIKENVHVVFTAEFNTAPSLKSATHSPALFQRPPSLLITPLIPAFPHFSLCFTFSLFLFTFIGLWSCSTMDPRSSFNLVACLSFHSLLLRFSFSYDVYPLSGLPLFFCFRSPPHCDFYII